MTFYSVSPETRVNTYTTGDQSEEAVIALSDGGYVVTWKSYGEDGSGYGVYLQRFDQMGMKVGTEVRVNSHTSDDQLQSSITALRDGSTVVTWTDRAWDGTSEWRIYKQAFDVSGNKSGLEILVSGSVDSVQHASSVTSLPDGGYVVVWDRGGLDNSWGIFLKRFDASGHQIGSETEIDYSADSERSQSLVTPLSDGGFVVAWLAYDEDYTSAYIHLQKFDDNAQKVGTEGIVGENGGIGPEFKSATYLNNGGYLITWAGGQVIDNLDVYMQIFDSSGGKIGSEIMVNSYAAYDQYGSSATTLNDGGFVITWKSLIQPRTLGYDIYDIRAQRFDAAGNKVGSEATVNSATDHYLSDSSVTALSDGGFVISWTDYIGDSSYSEVYAQRFDASGAKSGSAIRFDSKATGEQTTHFVTALSNGGFVITMSSVGQDGSGGGIYQKVVSPADDLFSNVMLSYDSVAVEMLRLADEVYGRPKPLDHGAEGLGSYPVAQYAQERNWHTVSADQLGISSSGGGNSGPLSYSFSDGFYQALGNNAFWNLTSAMGGDQPEANALVLSGMVDGQMTLSITFRGTDQYADILDYVDFQTHYAKCKPLIDAVLTYLNNNPDITQVLVSGHSLGAAMVEYFGHDIFAWDNESGHTFMAFTDGSPGSEAAANPASVVNFIDTNDPVPMLGDLISLPWAEKLAIKEAFNLADPVLGAAIAFVFDTVQPKPREGSDVYINSDVSLSNNILYYFSLAEHGSNLYVENVIKLLTFAQDIHSPFYSTGLAAALRDNTVYTGADLHISVGSPIGYDSNQDRDNFDARYPSVFGSSMHGYRDDDYVLGTISDDSIYLNALDVVSANGKRIFDGGAGSDRLVLPFTKGSFTYDSNFVNGETKLYWLGAVGFVGSLYRIETLVFHDFVSFIDGHGATVELPHFSSSLTADNTLPTFTLTGNYDYADAGHGNMNVVGTAAGDIIYLGTGNKSVDGGEGDDILIVKADDAGDTLRIDGGAGADIIYGGQGIETYIVDDAGDQVNASTSAGMHTVEASANFQLSENLQNLELTGGAIMGSGNALGNQITGDDLSNILDGGGGADTLIGGLGDDLYFVDNKGDVVTEAVDAGTDTVISSISYTLGLNLENLILTGSAKINGAGNALDNIITGNTGVNSLNGYAGNDTLDGGAGADTMKGGPGDDTFYVDNTGDVVIENSGEGNDHVYASVTCSLAGQQIESLTLTGGANINATGNGQANSLTGNAGANALNGGSGNDILDGGLGADTMTGGLGNDVFYVDNSGDTAIEANGGGTDRVYATVSYNLGGQFVENLTLTGSDNINATGNSLTNTLTGNAGNNVLDGSYGADTMTGGLGDDTFYVDNAGDIVVDAAGQGADIIYSSVTYTLAGRFVENLTLTGSNATNATGNSLDNILVGNGAANRLNGGFGHDVLTGKSGADTFVFDSKSGADTITDFSTTQGDTIDVSAYTHGTAHAAYIHQVGADTTIDLGGGNIITVSNMTATNAAFLSHIVW